MLNPALSHQTQKLARIQVRISVLISVSIPHCLRRSQRQDMGIVDITNALSKVPQIIALGKPGQLRDIIQTDINNPSNPRAAQTFKKSRRRLFRKANSEN